MSPDHHTRKILCDMVRDIHEFDVLTEHAGETDTGDAWMLLVSLRDRMMTLISNLGGIVPEKPDTSHLYSEDS